MDHTVGQGSAEGVVKRAIFRSFDQPRTRRELVAPCQVRQAANTRTVRDGFGRGGKLWHGQVANEPVPGNTTFRQ
jgi:hypothetical protein